MRVKDYNKKDAIFEATIKLLNEIGFENISMSKIGKEAGVSSSTIYVYFENKNDMLKKIYIEIKKKMGKAMSNGIYHDLPMRQVIDRLVRNVLKFVQEQTAYFLFTEQFSGSPLLVESKMEELVELFEPLWKVLEAGINSGELKKAEPNLLMVYCYSPIAYCAQKSVQHNIPISESLIELLVQMSWDAVKA